MELFKLYLSLSAVLFFIGIYGFIARRNLIGVLMSVELIMVGIGMSFSVFNRFLFPDSMEGMFVSIFSIAISAAEAAIAIAIIINVYRNTKNIKTDEINKMKY